ncbi:MAG: c-type cytochrome biogenesis protein CcmI [Gammaproteobacteria bacterium]|nr:c-type cytochrome biogenesis protein CcmI [Gammaproteobacteria bacterium]
MSFWIIACLLIVGAVLLTVWPLARADGGGRGRALRANTVRALYQQRLRELDDEVAGGALAADAREEVAEELGAALLGDYQADAEASAPAASASDAPAKVLALVLAVLLPALSLGLYLKVGEPTADNVIGAESLLSLDPNTQSAEIERWRDRLAQRVEARPEDAQSWYLLGHARLQMADYQRAAEAFAMAHALHGVDPTIDVYWLQARYLAAGGVIDDGTRGIAQRLLETTPNHPMVLEMFAIDAFRSGEFRRAVDFLNRALAGNLNPTQRAALATGLKQARAQLGDLQPSLDVAVSAAGSPPAGATLFVIARPPGGGMPYAVVRRPAAQLPASVRLDDAVSMNPAQALSQASQVEVVVRLSMSGSAMAQPGDWEWRSATVDIPDLDAPLQLEALLQAPEPAASSG